MAGNKRAKSVVAETFQLTDKAGATRAILNTWSNGLPYLQMFDNDGKLRIALGIESPTAAHISLVRDDGLFLAGLRTLDEPGRVALFLYDREGNEAFSVEVSFDGSRAIELRDRQGKCVWRAE